MTGENEMEYGEVEREIEEAMPWTRRVKWGYIRMGRCNGPECPLGGAYLWDRTVIDARRVTSAADGTPFTPSRWVYRATGEKVPCPECGAQLHCTQRAGQDWYAYPV